MLPSHPCVLLLAALGAVAGCRVTAPERVVEGHHELCCKAANPDNLGFVGCRASSSCRTSERVWLRGPVSCGPADAPRCAGGRCCELELDVAQLELGVEVQVSSRPVPAEQFDGARVDAEPAPEPVIETAPEPMPIVPVPLDWQARPTAVTIPKLLCPATIDRGLVGSVELRVDVDARGRVTEVAIRTGIDPQCDALAREALLRAQFEPARMPTGQPIASSTTWVYEFSRDEGDEG